MKPSVFVVRRLPRPRWDRVLVLIWLIGLSVAKSAKFDERDPYWQARAGMENLAGQSLARPDAWSWSAPGAIWYQNSPLWNSLLGIAYSSAGFWGIFAVTLATMSGYFLLAHHLAIRLGGRHLPALAGIMLAALSALAMLSPRATLAVQVIILGAVLAALLWAEGPAARRSTAASAVVVLGASAILSTLGNWVHLSFLLVGPVMAAVWAVIWLFTPVGRARKTVLIAAGAAGWCFGPLLSPYGIATGLERARAVQEACEGLILEWSSPFTIGVPGEFPAMAAIAALVSVAVSAWLLRRVLRGRRDLATGGLLALSLVGVPASLAGVTAIRFLGVGLLTLAPVMGVGATALVDLLRRLGERSSASRWWEYTTGGLWRVVLWLTTAVLLPMALWAGANHSVPTELSLADQLPTGCRLYSDAGFAGAVVLERPDVPVWMDGRADFFGRAHLTANHDYVFGEAATVVPPGTTCVALDTSLGNPPLVAELDAAQEWQAAGRVGEYRLWLPAAR